MKILVLAAGYATRLHPLTLTLPKPLLPVAGKPMINYVIDNLASLEGLDLVYVVTNARFSGHFRKWADDYHASHTRVVLKIVDDGSTDDAGKLGAIGDLNLVLDQEHVDDDVLVVAGDNLFSEPLTGFGTFCREKNAPVLGVYDVGSLEQAKKYGVVEVDREGRITSFIEKPSNPKGTNIGIALYFYPRAMLPLVKQYMAEGNNPDQPGRLVQWLYPKLPFFTWNVPGVWYDIGSKETLEEANRIFSKR